ncbi:DUF6531 domain-containing protein, partial [Pseudomonas aeruginosa]
MKKPHLLLILFASLLATEMCFGEDIYRWRVTFYSSSTSRSPSESCEKARQVADRTESSWAFTEAVPVVSPSGDVFMGYCRVTYHYREKPSDVRHCDGDCPNWRLIREGSSCPLGAEYNQQTGECDCRPGHEMDDSGCKLPDKNGLEKGPPPPEGCAGNPVNITNGNKYQVEHDLSIPIPLTRYYNGLDGLWRHSYSARITRKGDGFLLYRENGKASEFTGSGKDLTSITDLGRLSRLPGKFSYTSELNEVMEFDQNGILTKLTTKEGRKYRVERGANLTIGDEHGNKLVLSEGANHQLLRAQIGGISIEYTYDKEQRLTSVTRTDGQYSTKTQYLYDDPRNIKLLTGIQDNNNRRFATWAYDNQGRAISSEHANGAEKVSLAYNDDGSTTVTNEYGKQATYRFQVIQGIKRIVA